ncbi:BLUF domain-containing protein [Acinetobacter sp. WCHAc060033]|uniref:BLUF domain-containing protein n=1 Tax=Acinetobacter sp. WCHAc060033 TaxID=2518624 RepID=UPI001023549F|nr:BLUF domain-containing protein [Acinetobacter sp. WCHAc060033]RZG85036.1 BLUF domain-containing protein [Acinetobacter sp. WCHAc060033]
MFIRLCYVSTRVEHDKNLLEDLSDILSTARQFNQEHQIYGVLYYSEGVFFQCLEGQQAVLDDLYGRISNDQRHINLHRFPDQPLKQLYFSKWSMKYVKDSTKISRFFAKLGLEKFQPYQLNNENIQDFVSLLLKIDNSEPAYKTR